MQIQLDKGSHTTQIHSYNESSLLINGTRYSLPIALLPEKIIHESLPKSFNDISEKFLEQLVYEEPEVLIVGTGNKTLFMPIKFDKWCAQHQISIDCMTTGAACRTFSLLASEKRKVAALLF